MFLFVNSDSEDFRFYKTLNEDVKISPGNNQHWDIQMVDGDYVNVTGKNSLFNAIVIALMTRFKELSDIPLYEDFGCRIHELIKANKSEMVYYQIELFVEEVLENMRRIQEVNEIRVTDSGPYTYEVYFNVTSIDDEIIQGSVYL